MNKVKILVVEDEMVVSMMICDLLEDLGYEVLDAVTSYEDAIDSLKKNDPDIAILDVKIDSEKSGIDVARYIKEKQNIPFIFLTSQIDSRTLDAAKILNPNAYLVKPFTKDDLYTAIELAIYNYQDPEALDETKNTSEQVIINDAFFVKSNNLFQKVKHSDILYAKSDHVYVEIYTNDKKRHLIRSSMNNFIENLPSHFFRVHRSYTINLDHLEAINSLYVIMKDHKIPIGTNYRNQLLQHIRIK
ncbi:MAG: response regulator [Bacteroidales bacterium]|nr:response regulator [Bacteroidales bacterium]